MASLSRQPLCVATGLLVPLLSLMSPAFLKLGGVSPAWACLLYTSDAADDSVLV